MGLNSQSKLLKIISNYETEIITGWLQEQFAAGIRKNLIKEVELREECREFLSLLAEAVEQGEITSIKSPQLQPVREMLASVARSRSQKAFSSSETLSFVLSLKQPLFNRLRQEIAGNPDSLVDEILSLTAILDGLALWTTEVYQKTREEVISRQQEELLELSTPVVKLWDGILALPLIGTLDSARTQIVMESLLQSIVDTGSEVAIIDITGVPTVDTLTAQYLLKTVTAARLMGADCIISGIRPQIAQTIVYLGVDLADVTTKATLADAFSLALKRKGIKINHSRTEA